MNKIIILFLLLSLLGCDVKKTQTDIDSSKLVKILDVKYWRIQLPENMSLYNDKNLILEIQQQNLKHHVLLDNLSKNSFADEMFIFIQKISSGKVKLFFYKNGAIKVWLNHQHIDNFFNTTMYMFNPASEIYVKDFIVKSSTHSISLNFSKCFSEENGIRLIIE